jgi:N-acetylglucosamine-6-phosphate deacetylase
MDFLARHYHDLRPVRIRISDGRIAAVDDIDAKVAAAELPIAAPAFLDLQINGYGGIWFSDADLTPERVLEVLSAYPAHGVSRLCPTVITNSFEAMAEGLAAIAAACRRERWADRMAPGCHVEGPYISAEDGPRGAHPLEHVRPCEFGEFERLQKAAERRIRLVTLAPESPGAADFIRAATSQGVRVAIGHTAANAEQIAAAVEAGACLSTHLGNGAHGTLRRHPNYIWEQLGEDRLCASLIADGHHLPASVLRSMIRAKGWERVILTCDASGLAGSPPGVYDYHGAKFEVLADGPIVIAGQRQYLAGSGQLTDVCVAKAVALGGVTLRQACDMAAAHPSRLLGFEEVVLRPGARADVVLFHPRETSLDVVATLADGEVRYGALPVA